MLKIINNMLVYSHDCQGCQYNGIPEGDDQCGMCEYTGKEIEEKYELVRKFNSAYKQVYGE